MGEEIIDIYKTYVTIVESDIDRRLKMNQYFFTLSASLTVGISFIITNKKAIMESLPNKLFIAFFLFLSLMELSVNLSWLAYLLSSRRLQKVQLEVVEDIEKMLPLSPLTLEYKKYVLSSGPFTRAFAERLVPLSFLGFGVALLSYTMFLVLL